jgi:hypothetical protein
MPTQQTRRNIAYGYTNPQTGIQQEPIIMQRVPTTADNAELGTIWIDKSASSFWILTNSAAGVNTWTATTGGATTLASLIVNPGDATVTAGDLTVSAGNLTVTAGAASLATLSAGATTLTSTLAVTGDTTIGGTFRVTGATHLLSDLTVDGTTTINGIFDFASAGVLSFVTTSNTNPAVTIGANGGAAETVNITSAQGTSATSIDIASTVGGVTIYGGMPTAASINISTVAGGGITAAYGASGMTLTGTGTFALATGVNAISVSADAAATAINIGTGAGVVKTISIGGTGANVIAIGNTQVAGSVAIGTAMIAGTISIGGTGAQVGTISIAPGTGAQIVNIATGGTGVKTVNIATGAIGNLVTLGTVTGAASLSLLSGTVGTTITSTGPITVASGTGLIGISADAAATTVNIATGLAVKTTTLGSLTGASQTTVQGGTSFLTLVTNGTILTTPLVNFNGTHIYNGAGVPANALALAVGDMYINTTAATAATRLYIATAASTWTNVSCAA